MRKTNVILAGLFATASVAALALPQAAGAQEPGPQTVRVSAGTGGTRVLPLGRGRSAYVDLPVEARDVLVSNPAVADVVARTPRRYYVMGVGPGQADAVFFDAQGRQILSLDVRVGQDAAAVADTIRRVVPNARVQVQSVNESLILSGSVANNAEADQVIRLASTFVPNPQQVVNMLTVQARDQVMVRARVVEVQRSVLRQFGVNLTAIAGDGNPIYRLATNLGFGVNGAVLGGGSVGYASSSDGGTSTGALAAFERVGLVRTLAEPNGTTVSGETANTLVGGEFPIPSGVDDNGNVLVTFRPFGVNLTFTPTVLSEGRISLRLTVEVSELNGGGYTYGPANARVTIPALSVRRSQNTVELPSGGSMMIAGLLQESSRQTIDRVPGVGSLPVLGALFRSRDYTSGETELVIIVTPYIVRPTSGDQLQTPADGMVVANDAQTLLMGRLNQRYRPAGRDQGRGWAGPFGWALD